MHKITQQQKPAQFNVITVINSADFELQVKLHVVSDLFKYNRRHYMCRGRQSLICGIKHNRRRQLLCWSVYCKRGGQTLYQLLRRRGTV